MSIDQQVERVFLQFRQDARRMAEANRLFAGATSRSSRLSTARLLGAQARTFSPRATAWRISSMTVVVLPVPGGP